MYLSSPTLPGTYPCVCATTVMPVPAPTAFRGLRSLIHATGLAWDAGIGLRDERLGHCIALPEAGVLLTATRASAPLLQSNCANVARISGLHTALLRFGSAQGTESQDIPVSACLILHDARGRLVAQEGYHIKTLPEGGLLLRHPLPAVADYLVGTAGLVLAKHCDGSAYHLGDYRPRADPR